MNARNPKYLSPFAKEAYALEMQEGSGGINSVNNFLSSIGFMEPENPYIGGKLDDITVVVAIVNDN